MLNIRMSRTPISGSQVLGCLTPRRAHILMWSRFVPGTTKCLHPNRGHWSYRGIPSGTRERQCEFVTEEQVEQEFFQEEETTY
jgi:hypothetical protein